MANTPLGVHYPIATDNATDLRATFQQLAESVGKPPAFASTGEANAWITANTAYAKPGLIITVAGKPHIIREV